MANNFPELKGKLIEIGHLTSTLAVLGWDQQVHMPIKGAELRGQTLAYLTSLLHDKILSLNEDNLITSLKELADSEKLEADQSVIIREAWRDYVREAKLPAEFVHEFALTSAAAHTAWEKAREQDDFASYAPHLEKMLVLSRQQAEYLGYAESPYDALLDLFEPGMTSAQLSTIFEELKTFLIPFIQKIVRTQPVNRPINGNFPIEKQRDFNMFVAERLGFDFDAGKLDISAHPFTTTFNPLDIRITTRYDQQNLFYSLGSTIHEVGHGLYEQGLEAEFFGLPLGQAASYGIHESQSRVWENQVGMSLPFWEFFYPELRKRFKEPFDAISLPEFYQSVNHIEPTLIRTESDEVTYNLHIVLRFEIERDLLEGRLTISDLPEVWNQKMKEYFGLTVPNNQQGVLQDVHWTTGFGYFPSYSLGNLYSAQIYNAAKQTIADLEDQFTLGNFSQFREWLRDKIHKHGRRYTGEELINQITGEGLNPQHFTTYLEKKFTDITKL